MRVIVFLGAPGSGKGTQAKQLSTASALSYVHLSTGDILRDAIRREEPLGRTANAYMSKGNLVPDEVMLDLINSVLSRVESTSPSATILMDGFPRTIPQATALDLGGKTRVGMAVFFSVPESVLIARLTGRRICKVCGASFHIEFLPPKHNCVCDKCGGALFQREDDSRDVVINRLRVFGSQNEPLLEHYRLSNRLVTIDADRPVEQIHFDIVNKLR